MVSRVAVVGATGRMGTLARRLIDEADDFVLHAAIGSSDSLDGIAGADIVFDLTVPAISPDVVAAALDRGIPALVGTSGWTAERIATLRSRVGQDAVPGVVIVPNFSLGSALATAFAVFAAPWFDSIEIVESHHPRKVDSPSGTAIRTAELIGKARAEVGPVSAPHADQRARGQQVASIPIHSLRHAGLSARQEVVLGGDGETVRIIHDTHTDASYEAGILLGLRAVREARGVVVGLDRLLDLGL
ncbi:MAG: 4-hydroxy-tetrahydrodipicolinate reductase [Pseudolysinimonas sp.]